MVNPLLLFLFLGVLGFSAFALIFYFLNRKGDWLCQKN